MEEILMDDVLQLYAAAVGCGILLSFIPWAIGSVIRLGFGIIKKGGF